MQRAAAEAIALALSSRSSKHSGSGFTSADCIYSTSWQQNEAAAEESFAGAALQRHLDDGFLTQQADYVSLTTAGLLIADTIISDFL